jgi:hypothetical protein
MTAEPSDLLAIAADVGDTQIEFADVYRALANAHKRGLDLTQAAPLVLPDLERAHRKLGAVIAELIGAAEMQEMERLRYEAAVNLPITAKEIRWAEES